MAVSSRGLRLGMDLSNPVRAVLFSEESGEIAAVMMAQTGFDQGSKERLVSLAREIKDFCRPFKVRPDGVASLPIENCHLFTVSIPLLDRKEFRQAIHLQVERVVPGGSNNMRMAVQEWPAKLPPPPSTSAVHDSKTYVVAAAESDSVRAAESLMKMAGIRPVAVEIPASPACRTSWRILTEMLHEINGPGAPQARFNIALVVGPGEAQLHLAFHSCPWLMREIPLDPDNRFVNAQILAGEVSRSARFVTNSLDGEFSGGITLMGSSEKIDFIADYLGEEVGIRTQVFGPSFSKCGSEYGVAAGSAFPKEGGELL